MPQGDAGEGCHSTIPESMGSLVVLVQKKVGLYGFVWIPGTDYQEWMISWQVTLLIFTTLDVAVGY